MTGLDTNVLVRYFAQDDLLQSAAAAEIIENRLSEEDPGFISLVTIAELVWELDRGYGLRAAEIASILESMLQAETFSVQSEQDVFTAMVALKSGAASFADALIGALGQRAGCSVTLTFDRKAARLPQFQDVLPQ